MGPSNSEYQIDVAAAVPEIYQLKVRATMVMVEISALSPGVQRSLIPKSKNSKNNRFYEKCFLLITSCFSCLKASCLSCRDASNEL